MHQSKDVLKDRYSHLDSIEKSGNKTNTTKEALAEIPPQIDALIDNKAYYPKFRKLIREGHLSDLLELARVAVTKGRPSRWFATVTSKKNWERTLEFVAELRNVAELAIEIASRLRVVAQDIRPIFKACWALKDRAVILAATAAETGRNRYKLFNYLASKEMKADR